MDTPFTNIDVGGIGSACSLTGAHAPQTGALA